jgi:hypothetical protein
VNHHLAACRFLRHPIIRRHIGDLVVLLCEPCGELFFPLDSLSSPRSDGPSPQGSPAAPRARQGATRHPRPAVAG